MKSANESDYQPGSLLYGQVVDFLYREAKLLDGHRYSEWFDLFADDIRYVMPVRTTQYLKTGSGFDDKASFFDDNLISLKTRVKRLETGAAWAETPPSRTRHFLSNILIGPGKKSDEIAVDADFMITRTRADGGYHIFTGRREDTLRSVNGGKFKIAQRTILVDQTVIFGTNLSILF